MCQCTSCYRLSTNECNSWHFSAADPALANAGPAAAGVYIRDVVQQHHHAAAAAAANLTAAPVPLPLHPAAAAANHLAAVGTSRAAPPVAAASAPSASSSAAEIHPLPKRMKMDLQHPAVVAAAAAQHVAAAESRSYVAVPPPGPPAHRPPPVAAAAPPPSAASSSLSTPLRIDTREAVKVRQKERKSEHFKVLPSPNQNSEPPAAAPSHNLAFVHVKLDGLSVRPTVHSAVIFSPPSAEGACQAISVANRTSSLVI